MSIALTRHRFCAASTCFPKKADVMLWEIMESHIVEERDVAERSKRGQPAAHESQHRLTQRSSKGRPGTDDLASDTLTCHFGRPR
jgi:Zn ribbon nucleic-acid-binding protein